MLPGSIDVYITGATHYNVQSAVDTKHHLMVAHEVTNTGTDRDQLSAMAKQVRQSLGVQDLTVIAGRGYLLRS